jgi:hypothetical protein
MPRNEKGPAFVETADPSSDDGFCAVDNLTRRRVEREQLAQQQPADASDA